MQTLQITMDVRAYREKPAGHENLRAASRHAKPVATTPKTRTQNARTSAQALWDYLLTQTPPL